MFYCSIAENLHSYTHMSKGMLPKLGRRLSSLKNNNNNKALSLKKKTVSCLKSPF